MTQAIVAKIPFFSPFLPKSQKTLAEKKLSGAVLTIFERFQHQSLLQTTLYKTFYEAKASHIHQINDPYTKIYDTTVKGLARVGFGEGAQDLFWGESIILHPTAGGFDIPYFSREALVDYGVVSDAKQDGKILVYQKIIPSSPQDQDIALTWISDVYVCAITQIPPVFEVHGWAEIEVSPEAVIRSHFAYLQPEPVSIFFPAEAISQLPVDDSAIGQDKQLMNRYIAGDLLSNAELRQHIDRVSTNMIYQSVFLAKISRIHSFREADLKLLDHTARGIVSVKKFEESNDEFIQINGIKVALPLTRVGNSRSFYTPFSKKEPTYTEYFAVHDIPGQNWVKIERHISPTHANPQKTVETRYVNLHQSNIIYEDFEEGDKEVFFAYGTSSTPPAEITVRPRPNPVTEGEPAAKKQAIQPLETN